MSIFSQYVESTHACTHTLKLPPIYVLLTAVIKATSYWEIKLHYEKRLTNDIDALVIRLQLQLTSTAGASGCMDILYTLIWMCKYIEQLIYYFYSSFLYLFFFILPSSQNRNPENSSFSFRILCYSMSKSTGKYCMLWARLMSVFVDSDVTFQEMWMVFRKDCFVFFLQCDINRPETHSGCIKCYKNNLFLNDCTILDWHLCIICNFPKGVTVE